MAKKQKIAISVSNNILEAIDLHASNHQMSRSEAISSLIESGFSHLKEAENIKNFIARKQENIQKKLDYESQKSFETLKNLAILDTLVCTILEKIKVEKNEIDTMKNAAINRFLDSLKD